jgi:hypothetical protein
MEANESNQVEVSNIKRNGIRVKAQGDSFDVLLFAEDATGKLHHLDGGLVCVPVENAEMVSHDMQMTKEDCEHLMQDLWEAGIRPEGWALERSRYEELQAAKKAHFDDVRDIAKKLAEAVSRG